jgi:hypothetical protein
VKDAERNQSFTEGRTYEFMAVVYWEVGYEVVELPRIRRPRAIHFCFCIRTLAQFGHFHFRCL